MWRQKASYFVFQGMTLRKSFVFGIIIAVENDFLPPETDLATVKATRAVLQRFGLEPHHRWGQNFLVNGGVVRRIVAAAELHPREVVLEVGPGVGTLTRALAAAAGEVVAVEVDAGLLPVLSYTLGAFSNVRVVRADVRRVSLEDLAREAGALSFKIVANLPYYLTSFFLQQLLAKETSCQLGVLMVQREVAARLLASPGSKDYGMLTVALQYYAEARVVTQVGVDSFWPRPTVTSTVLKLVRRREPGVKVDDE